MGRDQTSRAGARWLTFASGNSRTAPTIRARSPHSGARARMQRRGDRARWSFGCWTGLPATGPAGLRTWIARPTVRAPQRDSAGSVPQRAPLGRTPENGDDAAAKGAPCIYQERHEGSRHSTSTASRGGCHTFSTGCGSAVRHSVPTLVVIVLTAHPHPLLGVASSASCGIGPPPWRMASRGGSL